MCDYQLFTSNLLDMSISITNSSRIAAVAIGVGLVLAVALGGFAAPAHAQLNSAQIQSILSLLQSFGADAATIANVNAALTGAPVTPGAGAGAGCTFTRALTIGATGADVTCLQQALISMGFSIPAGATGYFGTQTQGAVSAWQAAHGVSPTAGYFGPISQGKWAMVAPPPGVPGVPTTPGAAGLQGTAGTATITSTSEDVETDVQTGTTEKVVGFKVEASGSDLRVTNVRVKFTKTSVGSASDFLTAYFNEVSIWADGQKVGSMSASSFTRDSAGVYSASIPVNQIVRMGSGNKVTFHVGATAVSSVDSDDIASGNSWKADVTQVRYTDASGAVLFEDPSSTVTKSGIIVERLSSSSDVKLRMGEGSGNPKSGNVKVTESGSTDITLAEFTLKAEGTDMTFDRFIATTTLSGVLTSPTVNGVDDVVQAFYLQRGSTRIAEISTVGAASANAQATPRIVSDAISQELFFNLDSLENLFAGDTKTYRIVAKVKARTSSTYPNGVAIQATTSPATYNVNAKASDGKSVTERPGSITTYVQTLFSEGIQIAKVSESFTHNANETTPANSTGEFKVTLRVTNFGSNDVHIPLNTYATTTVGVGTPAAGHDKGVSYGMISGGGTATSTGVSATLTRVSGGTELTNSVRISGGQSADFQLTITFNPDTAFVSAQQYRTQIWGVGHAATDVAAATSFVASTPVEDFRTGFYTVNN